MTTGGRRPPLHLGFFCTRPSGRSEDDGTPSRACCLLHTPLRTRERVLCVRARLQRDWCAMAEGSYNATEAETKVCQGRRSCRLRSQPAPAPPHRTQAKLNNPPPCLFRSHAHSPTPISPLPPAVEGNEQCIQTCFGTTAKPRSPSPQSPRFALRTPPTPDTPPPPPLV